MTGGRCSGVALCNKKFKWDLKMVAVRGRWSPFGVVVSSGLTVLHNNWLTPYKSYIRFLWLTHAKTSKSDPKFSNEFLLYMSGVARLF